MSQEKMHQSESTEQINAPGQKDHFTAFFCIPVYQNILANYLTFKEWLSLRQINKTCLVSHDNSAALKQVFINEFSNTSFTVLLLKYASLEQDFKTFTLIHRFITASLNYLGVEKQSDFYTFTSNSALKVEDFLDDLSSVAQKTLKTRKKYLHLTSLLPNLLNNYVYYLSQFACALKNNKPPIGCDLVLIPESSELEDLRGLPGGSLFAYGIQGSEFYYIDKQENKCIAIESRDKNKIDQIMESFKLQNFLRLTNETPQCLINELDFNDLKKITALTGHAHLANHYQFYSKSLSSSALADFTDFFKLSFHFESVVLTLCICYKLLQMYGPPKYDERAPIVYLVGLLFSENFPLLSQHCLLLIDVQLRDGYIGHLIDYYEELLKKGSSRLAWEHALLKKFPDFFKYFFTEEILMALVKNRYHSRHIYYIDQIIYTSCFTLPQKVFLAWGYPDRDAFSLYRVLEDDRLDRLTDEQLIAILQDSRQEYKGLELLLDFLRREYKKKPYLTSRFQKRLNSFILNKLLCDLSEKINSLPVIGDRPPYDFYYYFFFVEFSFSNVSTLAHFSDDSICNSFQMTHHYWFLEPYSSPYWINFTERQLYETPTEPRLWDRLIKNSAFRARLQQTKLIYSLALLSKSVAESLASRKQKPLLRNLYSTELATLAGEQENEALGKLAGQKRLKEKLDQSPETSDWHRAGKYAITLGLFLLIGLGVILCATGAGAPLGLSLLIASFLSVDVTILTLTVGCLSLFLGGIGIALTWIENPITQLRIKFGFIPPYVITPSPHIPTAPQIRPIIQSAHSTQNQQELTKTVTTPSLAETSVASSFAGPSQKHSLSKKITESNDLYDDEDHSLENIFSRS